MPRPRFHRLDPDERRRLLDVAADAFAAHGYERTSYNELLDALGLSKGSAYHMFEGKADLYGAVVRDAVEQLAVATPPLAASDTSRRTFWRDVGAWLARTTQALEESPRHGAVLQGYAAARAAGTVTPFDHELDVLASAQMRAVVDVGRALGVVRDDLPAELLARLATALLATFDMHYLAQLDTLTPATVARLLDVYVDALRRLLAPGRAAPHRPGPHRAPRSSRPRGARR